VLADAAEVAAVRWVPLPELRGELTADPRAYAPWLAGVTQRLEAYLKTVPGSLPGSLPGGDAGDQGEHGR
jgi:isopentenyl-diphosphate delta-isomerase